MPDLEELLLKRQQVPSGAPTGIEGPPQLESMGRDIFEGGIDTLMGLFGVGPDTKANAIGQMMGAAAPVFRVGGKVLKKVGDSWQWLPDVQSARVNTKIDKVFETPQVIKSMGDIKDVVPPTGRTPAPKISGKWGAASGPGPSSMSRSKLNTSMAKSIRERGQAGEDVGDLAKEYGVRRDQITSILRGDSWNWVK